MIAARTELPVARATASWKRTSSTATSAQGTLSSPARRRDIADDVLELRQGGRVGAARGPGCVLGLEGHAELGELARRRRAEAQQVAERAGHQLGARLGHEGAATRAGADLEHALGLERAQGLAQRRARHPEGRAQIPFARQPLAGSDAARCDRIADLPDDVVERAHALRGDERRGRWGWCRSWLDGSRATAYRACGKVQPFTESSDAARRQPQPPGDRNRLRGTCASKGTGGVGAPDHPPADRRARLHDAAPHHRRGSQGLGRRRDALLSRAGAARAARGLRRPSLAPPRARDRSRQRRRRAGRQAVPVLRRARDLQSGRRGHLPEPRVPDLRVRDQVGRRDAGAAADHRGPRLRVQRGRPGRAPHARRRSS